MTARLPVVVVPILHRFDPLDACLAALESSLPRRTRVWLLDDVSSDPRIEALVHAWRERRWDPLESTCRHASLSIL